MNQTLLGMVCAVAFAQSGSRDNDKPSPVARNVVIIMTDDQGFGDLGCKGNPVLRTPNIDRLAAQSAEMTHFYVSPVCTPTRAALMTGRHAQRTHAIDTWIGRAMLEPEEVTLAEMLLGAGFATGIFGKWHLGDCAPMTPNDQGFEYALVHRGGGIGQPADPPGGEGKYTDPVLFENGERREMTGYCTDIYFDRAIEWMGDQHDAGRRFFTYVPTNAPHGPFGDVPQNLYEYYKTLDLSPSAFPQGPGFPMPDTWNEDTLARIYAMVENIDQNIGRLIESLDEMGILDDTLVIYLHDNGQNTRRFVTGFKGMKGTVYEGGVRTPFFVRWPRAIPAGHTSDVIAAHYDIAPTVLEACGVSTPHGSALDGRSLMPLLRGGDLPDGAWAKREIVLQAHRGNHPVRYHNMMIRDDRWKLLNASGFGREVLGVKPRFELYDMHSDPFEQRDAAAEHPEIVAQLRAAYDAWFEEVGADDPANYRPIPIDVGGERSRRVVLTRQDWRPGPEEREWGRQGVWHLNVVEAGRYEVLIRTQKDAVSAGIFMPDGTLIYTREAHAQREFVLAGVDLARGAFILRTEVREGDETVGAYQVVIRRE